MAVRIRLSRFGRLHRPYFRIVAIDGRCHREGKANEVIGSYDPALPDGKAVTVQMDRVEAWVKEGALVSNALINLFKFHGYTLPASMIPQPTAAKSTRAGDKPAKKDGKKWVAPTRRAARKHALKLKGERKVKAAEEKAKRDAAKAAAPAAESAPA